MTTTIREAIQEAGGPAAFARMTGCPIDTAKKWSSLDRHRLPWLGPVLMAYVRKHRPKRNS